MTVSLPQVCCPNLNCSAPLNAFGSVACENCGTPMVYRYLWAVGEAVLSVPVGGMVAGRYYVKAPQVWLDTQPALPPEFPPMDLPDEIQAYLHLCPQRLHVPEVYGVCSPTVSQPTTAPTDPAAIAPETDADPAADPAIAPQATDFPTYRENATAQAASVVLLESVPLDDKGNLFPAIAQSWASATAVRQVYWLWQLLDLWQPLAEQGAIASLLIADNIRVEGWRVRLCQLFWDEGLLHSGEADGEPMQPLSLADLAILWLGWVDQAHPTIADHLRHLCYEMRAENVDIQAIATELNHLLLQQAAQLPLRLTVASQTDTGPQHQHNEDHCYPPHPTPPTAGAILSQFVAVCDGIGGHEGGEIASQLAVQSLKLQMQALLSEVTEQTDVQAPAVIAEQLGATVRVINDLISNQNDTQGREARRRMGTTLVMGVQVPQPLALTDGAIAQNSHELYLVNVGDSRAYWITPRYCHLLTLDDDVATRETRLGRMLYREALLRADAGSLIQAVGTRDAEFLHPSVQRFVIEEDGVLLLCSDGLSDNGWVEASWQTIMPDVFRGKRSLEWATDQWIQLANHKNGHDNATVVLLHCHVSSPAPTVSMPPTGTGTTSDWAASSRALLDTEAAPTPTPAPVPVVASPQKWLWLVLLALLIGIGGTAIWWQTNADRQPPTERVTPSP